MVGAVVGFGFSKIVGGDIVGAAYVGSACSSPVMVAAWSHSCLTKQNSQAPSRSRTENGGHQDLPASESRAGWR